MPRPLDRRTNVKANGELQGDAWAAEVGWPALRAQPRRCAHLRSAAIDERGLVCAEHLDGGVLCRRCLGVHLAKVAHPGRRCVVCGQVLDADSLAVTPVGRWPATDQGLEHHRAAFRGTVTFTGLRLCSTCGDTRAS